MQLGEDRKTLEVFGPLICFTDFFQFSLCSRNCEGCVRGGVYTRKASGNFSLWPALKEKALALHQKISK